MGVSRQQAFGNFLWKLLEQMGSQGVSFVVAIILARLLVPEDYSAVSIVAILTSFCAIFIEGGLSKALIQKKNTDRLDYSTTLIASLCISLVLYIVLFSLAPLISTLYDNKSLILVIRVYSLKLFAVSFNTVQCAYISKKLQFKKYFVATLGGTIISAIVGISLALLGFGVWALVSQQMLNLFIDTFILYIISDFRPDFNFSVSRLKILWSYGYNVLGTSVLDMIYENAKPLLIGIKFNTNDLIFYEKGRTYPGIVTSTLNATLSAVLFPVISSAQDDIWAVKNITKRYIKITSFIVFPALLGLASLSENLIIWMLTSKWIEIIPYLKIFCINHMFQLLQTGNLQAINAIGRSDIVFKLAVIKKTISFIVLFYIVIIAPSPLWIAMSGTLTSFIAFIINTLASKSVMNYGIKEQLSDILPNLLTASCMVLWVLTVGKLEFILPVKLIVQTISGALFYFLIAFLTHNSCLIYCWNTLWSFINAKKN